MVHIHLLFNLFIYFLMLFYFCFYASIKFLIEILRNNFIQHNTYFSFFYFFFFFFFLYFSLSAKFLV